jgi:hypothetical protein
MDSMTKVGKRFSLLKKLKTGLKLLPGQANLTDGLTKKLKSGLKHLPGQANLTDSLMKLKPGLKLVLRGQTTSKSRRTVSFEPPSENTIYEVPHINDYSSELISSIWYSDTDYRRIETSCAKIIRKMNSDEPMEKMKKKYCTRGLENFIDARIVLASRTNRKRAIYAVLDEQELQWRDNVLEPAEIADIYAEHCLDCKIDAITTARRDELESQ